MAAKQPPQRKRRRRTYEVAKDTEVELRRQKAVELRVECKSLRAIAAELGVSPATIQSDIDTVLDRTMEAADTAARRHRQLSLERLDLAAHALMPKIKKGDAHAVDRLVRIENRRAKLLGLDASERVELSGPNGTAIPIDARTTLVERLAGLIAGEVKSGAEGGDRRDPDPGRGGSAPA